VTDPLISGAQLPALRRALRSLEGAEHHPESWAPRGPVLPGEALMKIFGREPAVWLHAIQAVLAFFITIPAVQAWGLNQVTADAAVTILAGIVAVWVAVATRPFVASVLIGAVQTILTGIVAFGFDISSVTQGALLVALNAALMVLMPLGLTPTVDPDPRFLRAQRDVSGTFAVPGSRRT
jgi:hypothetical protein